jgi:hypothetical protein
LSIFQLRCKSAAMPIHNIINQFSRLSHKRASQTVLIAYAAHQDHVWYPLPCDRTFSDD